MLNQHNGVCPSNDPLIESLFPVYFLTLQKKAAPKNTIAKMEKNLALDVKIVFLRFFQ